MRCKSRFVLCISRNELKNLNCILHHAMLLTITIRATTTYVPSIDFHIRNEQTAPAPTQTMGRKPYSFASTQNLAHVYTNISAVTPSWHFSYLFFLHVSAVSFLL